MGVYHRDENMSRLSSNFRVKKTTRKTRERLLYYYSIKSNSSDYRVYLHTKGGKMILYGNCSNKKHKKVKKNGGKRKTNELVPLIVASRLYGEKIEVEVSKKGGKYQMAGGCILTIEEGMFLKNAAIASCIVPPNKRADFAITCEYQSFLISEIFLVCSRFVPKKPISVYIPSVVKPNRFCHLIACTKTDVSWIQIQDFVLEPEGISFLTDTWGLYALIQNSPHEKINVTKKGGLINTLIHPLVSIRIPKLASPVDSECRIQFLQTNREAVEEMASCYPGELSNIVNVSPMLCIIFPHIQFKRPVTVKVPLPKWAIQMLEDQDDSKRIADLMLLCKRQGSWDTIESIVNYTKNTFSFDTKIFGTFVLLEPRANREGKVKHSLPRFEYANNAVRGAFLVFLWFDYKSWFIWIELAPTNKISQIRAIRETAGLVFIEQNIPSIKVPTARKSSNRSSRRQSITTQNTECRRSVELSEGLVFHLHLEGDVKFKDSSKNAPIVSRQFQKMFQSIMKKSSIPPNQGLQKPSSHSSNDSDDDFLSKIGKKAEPMANENDKAGVTISVNDPVSLIYYSKLEENYRIIEIEPANADTVISTVVERWKQKNILDEDRNSVNADKESDQTVGDTKRVLPKINSQDSSQIHTSEDSQFNHQFQGPMLRAQTKESMARIQLEVSDEADFLFNGNLKITQETFSLQIPPNQFESEFSYEKSLQEDSKIKLLESYIPKDLQNSDYLYKFYIQPEEMREYLGIAKPTQDAVTMTRDANAEKLLNPYLKEVPRENVDVKMLEKTKLAAISNITSKTNQVLDSSNAEFNASYLKPKVSKVAHKVSDRINIDEIYKEPKVISGKSLKILSSYIEQGLTLAVHLNISDSAITGIGFDSLSASLTLADVTYKVLNHWKRTTLTEARHQMVPLLIHSLHNMNLQSLADIVKFASDRNEELVKENFKFMTALPQSSDQKQGIEDESEIAEDYEGVAEAKDIEKKIPPVKGLNTKNPTDKDVDFESK